MVEQSYFQGAERNFKIKQHYIKTFREIQEVFASMTKGLVSIKNNMYRNKIELLEIKIYYSWNEK